ncbi:unnamed protein product [Cylicocyclus nassatus]|uniref:Uncharacterized protein n=1 Tax=Cylicocyclus nassatus TaxID=53992 RepID=A0AA36DMD1_CYLNA|nr:unnamed protein product [Cylicocyclus nassatus]
MFVTDYKRNFKCAWHNAKSSPPDSTNFSFTATCASVHTFSDKADVLETANYVVDERPKRVASRLVQLCDDFDKELFHNDCYICHILSLLLSLLSWLIWS